MKLFAIATGLSLAATALMGQGGDSQPMTLRFQAATTIGDSVVIQPAVFRGAPVTGSPMSATEVNKTVQTLSDGTEIQNVHTTIFYRDSLGRTRTEPEKGQILIMDPVAGVRITLNPSTKTAMRVQAPALAAGRGGAFTITPDGEVMARQLKLEAEAAMQEDLAKMTAQARTSTQTKNQANNEDLGFLMQNGVMAQGTRSTLTIPQGQIGNNRDIHVVNERWYSKDLQMIVKSVNSDPRFGVPTFELTHSRRTHRTPRSSRSPPAIPSPKEAVGPRQINRSA